MGKAALIERLDEVEVKRRMPIGAEVQPDGRVHFRVWAPNCKRLAVAIFSPDSNDSDPRDAEWTEFPRDTEGYFAGFGTAATVGSRYGFRLDDDPHLYHDPASRFQPDGPHGLSQVVDPLAFPWTDAAWRGVQLPGQVIYELHVGTFTKEGTWVAAQEQLQELAECGITLIEVMPVSDFPGRFGWGYDGVCLFAPTRLYGSPDDFRRFVNHAHSLGIGVILDVVYNHFGPDGNYLHHFADDYFTSRYRNDWGEAINFDGENSEAVREFFISNAGYWIDEYHLDGLRLDATQDIHDASDEHILKAITQEVRRAAQGRGTVVVAENEPQSTQLVRPVEQGGYGIDAVWNDDFHHSAMVALTGHNEAYYTDYLGRPQEFISSVKHGYLYQGQWYSWQKKGRGSSTRRVPPATFVNFLQNHDQLANSATGTRCQYISSPGRFRALTALLLLGPGTPLLFQGQEFGAATPFFYFADQVEELSKKVWTGRKQFLSQFRSIDMERIPDPGDPLTFTRSKLDFSEREKHAEIYRLHRDLLKLRQREKAFRAQRAGMVDGAVLSDEAFVLRFFGEDDDERDERLLIINLGHDLTLSPAPEPLLGPPAGMVWKLTWSSEDPVYGGCGTCPLDTSGAWRLTGQAAMVIAPEPIPAATADI